MSRMIIVFFFWLAFLLLDWYIYRGLKYSFPLEGKPLIKVISNFAYWSVPLTLTAMTIYFFFIKNGEKPSTTWILGFMGVFILFYVPKLILLLFNLVADFKNILFWIAAKFEFGRKPDFSGVLITRQEFLRILGTFIAALPFASILYGIVFGRFAFRTEKKTIKTSKLNAGTRLRVVQISDAHLGSFLDHKKPVRTAINEINKLEPDLILFTGDLVNDIASEAEPWVPEFSKLQAKYGKYSVLGNHDYGDYYKWDSVEEKRANLDRLKTIHGEMGFTLMLNEGDYIEIEGQQIYLGGVENWGLPPFPQHGDIERALAKYNPDAFGILMSHDPTHFDEQVKTHQKAPDLTLSGHTHGMQFGLILGSFKWSPVQYRYKKWAGTYMHQDKMLYVNRGFGYIGFPGRVGMPPEISLFEIEGQA
ncbi:metallophosphoesterase [Luteibaculum oceani]|uniref:Metallophosphoesterase n=1 Tax=Luteibaculum oceani TaxID=1294296 RepID=A0A5C6VEA0_9FLAO|nr:metallophosphoesterase [Luteibaculum oceani]TXC82125.1 metallophosphoesterase [Luteibaculum oceani]